MKYLSPLAIIKEICGTYKMHFPFKENEMLVIWINLLLVGSMTIYLLLQCT
jgi:hypothetical protein